MKSISKKQFKNAVAKVFNGGKSKLVATYEYKPFSWDGYSYKGTILSNSKFLRNDARGGKANDVYLRATIADGYAIELTTIERNKLVKAQSKKDAERKAKLKEANDRLKEIAKLNGFKSVASLKRRQIEIDIYNNARFNRAVKERKERYIETYGSYNHEIITDRVRIQRISLVFDCERIEDLF